MKRPLCVLAALLAQCALAAPTIVNPRMYPLVVPAYRNEWLDAKLSGTVELAVTVSADGTPAEIQVISEPSPFDDEVRNAVRYWFFEPPSCFSESAEAYVGTFQMVFSIEDGRQFVTIRNSHFAAPFESVSDARLRGYGATLEKHRVAGRDLVYPKDAMWRNQSRGVTYAMLDIDKAGEPSIVGIYSLPKPYFEKEVRRAIHSWRFEPPVNDLGQPAHVRGCLEVKFKLLE
jgi:TonB family protein